MRMRMDKRMGPWMRAKKEDNKSENNAAPDCPVPIRPA